MYTQCPECRTTYQIGPEDLRRAHGRVRCGACSTVFDALDTLSHEPPPVQPDEAGEPATVPEPAIEPGPIDEHESEPASEDAVPPPEEPEPDHPEDSLAEQEPEPEPEPEPEAEPEPDHHPAETDESPETIPEPLEEPQRFDDDTPLEEVLASFGVDLTEDDDEGTGRIDEPATETGGADGIQEAPAGASPETGPPEKTEDLGDEDEWRALLAELELDESALGAGLGREDEDEPAAEPVEPAVGAAEEEPAREPADAAIGETEPELRAEGQEPEAAGEVPPAEAASATEEPPVADETEPSPGTEQPAVPEERDDRDDLEEPEERDELAASAALFDEIVQSGEFAAILTPDTEAAAAAAGATGTGDRDRSEGPAAAPIPDVETAARPEAGDGGQPPAEDDQELIDQTLMPRRQSPSRTLLWSAAAAVLVLALGAQLIHGQRAQLATRPDIGPRLQQIYGAFGVEVEPRWDIGALCVESSSGDAGDSALEITSVIVHRGDRPQPYPLLQVALTDRWQSVIGSRSVEADEYLPAEGLHEGRMYPGDRVRARARLADPGSEAAGYELHVCYRNSGDPDGGLRCSGACR